MKSIPEPSSGPLFLALTTKGKGKEMVASMGCCPAKLASRTPHKGGGEGRGDSRLSSLYVPRASHPCISSWRTWVPHGRLARSSGGGSQASMGDCR